MGVVRTAGLVGALCLVAVACDASVEDASTGSTAQGPPGAEPIAVAETASATTVDDTVPRDLTSSADSGCVDEPGAVTGAPTDWYPDGVAAVISLTGEQSPADTSDPFQRAADAAVNALDPGFILSGAFDFARTKGGCATHHYATFARGEEEVVVTAWRVEAAGNTYWIPSETPFTPLGDDALASEGEHLAAVLLVAPDGTTVRVSSYGSRARDMVTGWPSTVTIDDQPGPTSFDVAQLLPIARSVMDAMLAARVS